VQNLTREALSTADRRDSRLHPSMGLSIADNRPSAKSHRLMAEQISNSPWQIVQRQAMEAIQQNSAVAMRADLRRNNSRYVSSFQNSGFHGRTGIHSVAQMARIDSDPRYWQSQYERKFLGDPIATIPSETLMRRLQQRPDASYSSDKKQGETFEEVIIENAKPANANAEYCIPRASKNGTSHAGYADLEKEGMIWEIKPRNSSGMSNGQSDVTHYVATANRERLVRPPLGTPPEYVFRAGNDLPRGSKMLGSFQIAMFHPEIEGPEATTVRNVQLTWISSGPVILYSVDVSPYWNGQSTQAQDHEESKKALASSSSTAASSSSSGAANKAPSSVRKPDKIAKRLIEQMNQLRAERVARAKAEASGDDSKDNQTSSSSTNIFSNRYGTSGLAAKKKSPKSKVSVFARAKALAESQAGAAASASPAVAATSSSTASVIRDKRKADSLNSDSKEHTGKKSKEAISAASAKRTTPTPISTSRRSTS